MGCTLHLLNPPFTIQYVLGSFKDAFQPSLGWWFKLTNILKMGWTPQPDTISNLNLKSLYVHVEEIPGSLVRVGVHILQCYNSSLWKTSTSESSEQQAPKQITRFERQRFQTCQDQLSCPSPDSETAGMKCTIWVHRVATSAKPSGSSARGLQVSQKSVFYFKRPLIFHRNRQKHKDERCRCCGFLPERMLKWRERAEDLGTGFVLSVFMMSKSMRKVKQIYCIT